MELDSPATLLPSGALAQTPEAPEMKSQMVSDGWRTILWELCLPHLSLAPSWMGTPLPALPVGAMLIPTELAADCLVCRESLTKVQPLPWVASRRLAIVKLGFLVEVSLLLLHVSNLASPAEVHLKCSLRALFRL